MNRSEDSTAATSLDSGLSEGIMSLGSLSNLVFTVKDFLEFIQSGAGSENEEYARLKNDLKHAELDLSRSQTHLGTFADYLSQALTSLDSGAKYLLKSMNDNIHSGDEPSQEANIILEDFADGAEVVVELRTICSSVADVVVRRRQQITEAQRCLEESQERLRIIKQEEENARIREEKEMERLRILEFEREEQLRRDEEERIELEKRNQEVENLEDSGYDPTNWPLITYPLSTQYNDGVMCDVICAVRAQPDTLDKMQMKCTLSTPATMSVRTSTPTTRATETATSDEHPGTPTSDTPSSPRDTDDESLSNQVISYPLPEGQYQLSNVICLESKGKPLAFDVPVCIAIPYRMPSGGSLSRDQLLCVFTKEVRVSDTKKTNPRSHRTQRQPQEDCYGSSVSISSSSSIVSTAKHNEAQEQLDTRVEEVEEEYGDEEGWTETTALDITFNDFPRTKFLEIRVRRLERLLIVAVLKQKTDQQWVTARGAKITSTVDSRVAVFVPRKAFKSPQQIHLKVSPVDGAVLTEMKSRFSNNYIVSCSPIVTVRVDSGATPYKPLSVSIPCQQSSGGQRSCQTRPKSSVSLPRKSSDKSNGSKRPSTAWAGNTKDESGDASVEENIQVLFRSAGQNAWSPRTSSQVKEDMTRIVRDNVLVDIDAGDISIIILKTIGTYSLIELTKNVGQIERQLLETHICFLVRQRDDDTAAVHVECCHSNATQRTMDNLSREGFTYGPGYSSRVYVEEGDKLLVTFRGNLTFDDEDQITFTFHKHLKYFLRDRVHVTPAQYSYYQTCRRATYIKEVDRFAQHGFDFYRGHVQLYRTSDFSSDRELLCELPMTLPKPFMEPTVVLRAPVVIDDNGPLTKAYFNELSSFIGDEWQVLADKLGIKKARMQNLMRGRSSSRQASIEDMLAQWFKRCPKKMDKVAELYLALCQSGRDDIANELKERNRQFIEKIALSAENDRLKKAYKVVISNGRIQADWKSLARQLSLSDLQINDIETQFLDNTEDSCGENRRVRCRMVLDTWRENKGENKATRKGLLNAVKRMKIITVIDELKNIR